MTVYQQLLGDVGTGGDDMMQDVGYCGPNYDDSDFCDWADCWFHDTRPTYDFASYSNLLLVIRSTSRNCGVFAEGDTAFR